MTGGDATVLVADDEGSGASPVKFGLGVVVVGSPSGGNTFEYDRANVTTPFIAPVFFKVVFS